MSNLSVSQTQITQTQVTQVHVQHSQRVAPPEERIAPPSERVAPAMERDIVDLPSNEGTALPAVEFKPEPTSANKMTKMIVGGTLLGSSIGAIANAAAKSAATETLMKPSASWFGVGAAIGGGIALINMETGDKGLNMAKNVAGGALLAGGIGAGFSSAAGSIFVHEHTYKSMAASLKGPGFATTAAAAALGTGIALANAEVSNDGMKMAKNIAAGGLIGGSVLSLGSSMVRSLSAGVLSNPSATMVALGAAAGAGIAILSTDTND